MYQQALDIDAHLAQALGFGNHCRGGREEVQAGNVVGVDQLGGNLQGSADDADGYLVPSAVEVPLYTPAVNDLLWAEGLIRSNGDRGLAATLINKTRVGRGGLPALTGAEPQDHLLAALQYEQEIEMMDIGANVFYNRRRIDGLQPFTPRQMPMPYKELDLLRRELYTYGGPDGPDMSASGIPPPGRIRNVHDIAREINEARIRMIRARRRW